ncbi:MAG TPA: DUF4157 domain-containing protein [Pseudonocardiaceae bacterium]
MHEHARRTEDAAHAVHRTPATQAGRAAGLRSPASVVALQRRVGNTAVTHLLAHDVLRTPGQPLDKPTRTEMQARLGADFSSVRVHTGPLAQRSAAQFGARAYTSGEHVVVGHGGADRHTLAHELTHVVQQRAGQVSGTDNGAGYQVSDPTDHFEVAAERNARRVMSGSTPSTMAGEPAPGHGQAAIQRDVGFEFETPVDTFAVDPGLRNSERAATRYIKQFRTRGQWEGRDFADPTATEYMGRGLRKKETIATVPGLFTMEADETTLGGSDLEFVTAAFPETAEGLAQLIRAMTQITEVAAHLSAGGVFDAGQLAKWAGGTAARPSDSAPAGTATGKQRGTFKKMVSSEARREYAVTNAGPVTANPQTTAGVLLSRIPDLVREITAPPPAGGPAFNPMGAEDAAGVQTRALQQVNAYLRPGFLVPSADPDRPAAPPSAELRGLLTLIATYLISGAASRQQNYVKGIAPLLARTDFATMYGQLPQEEQANFKEKPAIFIDTALRAAGLPTTDGPVVAGVIGTTPPQGNIQHVTRRIWLNGMVDGTDLMSGAGYARYDWGRTDNAEVASEFESMGSLGSRTDPGDLPILELRRMKKSVPFGQWTALARAAFELIGRVNH